MTIEVDDAEDISGVGFGLEDSTIDIAKIAEENYNLIYFVVNKYINTEQYNTDDLIGAGEIGYTKALNNYDISKGFKFSTFAIKCIQNEIFTYLKKENKYNKSNILLKQTMYEESESNLSLTIDNLNYTYNDSENKGLDEILIKDEEIDLLYNTISQLTEQEQYVISLRYGLNNLEEKTQREIGEELNLSQSYINRIEKQVLKKLYKNMKKNIKI